jgi:hypothetical protein
LPSHKDLLTVIEIVVAQQTKLEQQKIQMQCLRNCTLAGNRICNCNVTQTTLAPPPVTGVTLHLAYQVPQAQLNQLSNASQTSLSTNADCFLTSAEIAADPYAVLLASEFQAFVAAQIGSAGIGPGDINIFGFSSDGDDIPGCSADVAGHSVTLGVSASMRQSLGDTQPSVFDDCWLTPAEIAMDTDAAAFAQAFVATTAAALGVTPDQIQLNGICAGCRDASLPMGGGCAASTAGR